MYLRTLLCVSLACCGSTHPQTTTPVASSTVAKAATRELRCRDAARACGDALISGNSDKIIDCMADEAIKFVGGREKVVNELTTGKADMARDGWAFDHVDIDPPQEIVGGSQLFAIVPQRVTMRSPKGHVLQRGYLLAVSNDAGQSWKFIDGAGLTNDNVKQIIPGFPTSIELPEHTKPEVVP